MPSFLHDLFNGPMKIFQDFGPGSGDFLIIEESAALSAVFEKDVFQLQDGSNHIVLFTILILLLKIGVYTLADFFQFSVMPDDLIVVRAAVAQKFCFHRIDYIVMIVFYRFLDLSVLDQQPKSVEQFCDA